MFSYLDKKIHDLEHIKTLNLFLIILLLIIVIALTSNFMADKFEIDIAGQSSPFENDSLIFKFFMAVFIGPFIETFLINSLPYRFFKFFVNKISIVIILCSSLFAILHYYSFLYVLMTFFGGILLNLFYAICINKKQPSYILTVLLHSLYNFIGFVLIEFFNF